METKKTVIVQKLKKPIVDIYACAEMYYSLLSALNGLKLTTREIQLVGFAAVKGNISYANIRQEFCDKYKSSPPTINNIISKLKKMGVLMNDGKKVRVNPAITLNFEKDILLQITLVHG